MNREEAIKKREENYRLWREKKFQNYEKIIKEGTIKKQVDLYYTNMALENVKIYTPIQIGDLGYLASRVKTIDVFLTDKQNETILKNVAGSKYARYHNNLKKCFEAFLLFKPTISTYGGVFKYLRAEIDNKILLYYNMSQGFNLANSIIKKLQTEVNKEELLGIVMDEIPPHKFYLNSKNEIIVKDNDKEIIFLVEKLNERIREGKEFFEELKLFLKKMLPLKPYQEFIQEEEDRIKKEIDISIKKIDEYIFYKEFNSIDFLSKPQKNVLMRLKETHDLFKESKRPLSTPKELQILSWEDVEVEVTEETLQAIKDAG